MTFSFPSWSPLAFVCGMCAVGCYLWWFMKRAAAREETP
jgi:hypothetical protein